MSLRPEDQPAPEHPPARAACAVCDFFRADRLMPGAAAIGAADRRRAHLQARQAGTCRRFPAGRRRQAEQWCDEFRRDGA